MFSFLFKKRRKEEILYDLVEVPMVELSPIGKETLELPSTPRLRRLDCLYVVLPQLTLPAIVDIPLRQREREP